MSGLRHEIFSVNAVSFEALALKIFRYQFENIPVYAAFAKGLGKTPDTVTTLVEIPFLPVEIFKTHKVYAAAKEPEIIFASSGTSGSETSAHHVADLELYRESFLRAFRFFYGDPGEWSILALLPSYLEREGSSLVYMMDDLVKKSGNADSGFYLNNYAELSEKLKRPDGEGKKIWLLGVTYALLDLAEKFPQPLTNAVVLETGGMKGKRKEMVREEVHEKLKKAFGVASIHSEYGMTELFSQAYSKGSGIFQSPPWMRVFIREINDPVSFAETGKTGGINIIDLANLYSCSFIATSDLGKLHEDGAFEVLGRFDNSEVRGCNLMVE
ncbi:MAG TPA: acyl transferase [Bacteroidia bacterium]|nr:acyl transferase [Bacteroidia bacterium]